MRGKLGIWSPPVIELEYLVVAGGGGGGDAFIPLAVEGLSTTTVGGGGGGAGGIVLGSTTLRRAATVTVTVGEGNGLNNGTSSVLGSMTAVGGGQGGNWNAQNGSAGGSGGGGGSAFVLGTTSGGAGTVGQGVAGSGGTVSVGGNGGGSGTSSSITGATVTYAVGGIANSLVALDEPEANTGNGGHGKRFVDGELVAAPTAGASGVVVIAYTDNMPALTVGAGLTYDEPTRAGYRVYRFTSGTGTVTMP